MEPSDAKSSIRWGWVCAATALCATACAATWGYTVDDAWITFRYARNAASGEGLVYNAGQRVEGFSSPLWVILATAAQAARLSVDHACKAAGLVLFVVMLARLSRLSAGRSWMGQLPMLLFATHAPLIAGIVCGLETGANAAILVLMLLAAHDERGLWMESALWGGLAILCRPENALLVGVHGAYRWWTAGPRRREVVKAATCWVGVFVVLEAARWAYYGRFVPNTAVAKLSPAAGTVGLAWRYCISWLTRYWWLILFALPAIRLRAVRPLVVNAWLLIVVQVAFVFVAGGDWMPQWRFMLPVGAMLLVLAFYGLGTFLVLNGVKNQRIAIHGLALWPQVAVCGIAVVAQLWLFRGDRWRLDYYRREQAAMEAGPVRFLADRAGWRDCVAARDIGVLGYQTECVVLDLVGLTDPTIAAGSGFRRRDRINRDYVFGRLPKYLMLQSEKGDDERPVLDRIARELVKDARFGEYRLAERFNMPGRHFCEIYQRTTATVMNR